MDKPTRQSDYPIPTRRNVFIIIALLTATGTIFFFAAAIQAWWQVALLTVAFALVGNGLFSVAHEAEHGMLFSNRRANDAMGVFLSLLFPAPFHLLRQGHIGHHQRNRSDDEAFDFYFEGEVPLLKFLQFYGILTGLFWLTIVLSNIIVLIVPGVLRARHFKRDKPTAALMDSLNPRYWSMIRIEAAAAILLHVLIVWGLGISVWHYAVIYLGFGVTWSAMQYVHHFGTERHVVRGARNLRLLAPIDWLWLHHNWHLTHHQNPTVPWIHLPRIGREEHSDHDRGQGGGRGRGFMLWYYLKMWRGPRRATTHVENRYAGRIIR